MTEPHAPRPAFRSPDFTLKRKKTARHVAPFRVLLLGHSVLVVVGIDLLRLQSLRKTYALRRFVVRRDTPASLVGISNSNPRRAPLVLYVFTLTSDELLVAAACRKC
jgi:hypothetical protein